MIIMELRNVVVVVFIFSMLLSCNKQPDKKELPVINLNSISAINDSITLSLDDLGWKEKLIPLETNDSCLLADISVICESINNYWIVSNGEVLKFDKEGRYDRRIGKVGQGPEEYGSAYKIQLDKKAEEVYVMDYFGRKMVVYDFNGKFIRTFRLPEKEFMANFSLYGNTLYYHGIENSLIPTLLAEDIKTRKMETICSPDREMEVGEIMLGNSFMSEVGDEIYLYHYFNDTIYRITPEKKLEAAGFINMKNLMFVYDEIILVGDKTAKMKQGDPRVLIDNFVNTDNFFFVFYRLCDEMAAGANSSPHLAVYDKISKKEYANVALLHNAEPVLSIRNTSKLFSADGKRIISYIQADALAETDLVPGIKEDDNPILVIYYKE